jgi:hypothetical protein
MHLDDFNLELCLILGGVCARAKSPGASPTYPREFIPSFDSRNLRVPIATS